MAGPKVYFIRRFHCITKIECLVEDIQQQRQLTMLYCSKYEISYKLLMPYIASTTILLAHFPSEVPHRRLSIRNGFKHLNIRSKVNIACMPINSILTRAPYSEKYPFIYKKKTKKNGLWFYLHSLRWFSDLPFLG